MAEPQATTEKAKPVEPTMDEPKEKKLTKKQLRILERAKQAATAPKEQDPDMYADLPLLQSQAITNRKWTEIGDLSADKANTEVLVRGRLNNIRAKGKSAFLVLRQGCETVQALIMAGNDTPKEMVKYAEKIPKESIVDVYGKLVKTPSPIVSTTRQDVELHVLKIFTVNKSDTHLPFQLEDASRSDALLEAPDSEFAAVNIDNRLQSRWVDLRTPANNGIMRIQSAVGQYFRQFLIEKKFVEIHTPKLLSGASESGASVFSLKYFDQDACLAQSPQFYKQIAAACAGLERVFEVGPVFRAENSNTHRHLCEFTGLDFEMTINEHYFEVLDLCSDLFIYIFDKINEEMQSELAAVNAQHPFEPLQYLRPTLRLTFAEGVALLKEAGIEQDLYEDLSTPTERALGKIVKEKYGTDFFILDKFPLAVRPFYTMPDPENPKLSNSYDFFIRGEEILSGAQRVHDVNLLQQRLKELNIPVQQMQSYVDSFRHGAAPHGGGGIGLERVVMLFLGLKNIRKVSMFPRDPKRLEP